jgi:hypothetical protein
MKSDWKKSLPSAEHRRHIRIFEGLTFLTDAQDVALRGYVAWKNSLAAVAKKARTKQRRRD